MNEINAHIPCGFRCYTKIYIKKNYNINQPSLPFDSGFFSPYSIRKILNTKYIHLTLENTAPCIKIERYLENNKKGVKFIESSYKEINEYIEKNGHSNKYLDTTGGYYTLLKDYDCVLAHYNWHKLSGKKITDPKENLKNIEDLLNRRKERLENIIKNSDILNIYHKQCGAQFIIINKNKFNLCDDIVKEHLITTFTKYEKKIIFHKLK